MTTAHIKQHDWEKHENAMLSVITIVTGQRYFIGVQVATALHKQTFNLYRTLRKRGAVLCKGNLEVIHWLATSGAVDSSTRSVMFLPYDPVMKYMHDPRIRRNTMRAIRNSKAKKAGTQIERPKHASSRVDPPSREIKHVVPKVKKRKPPRYSGARGKGKRKRRGDGLCLECGVTQSSNWYSSPDGQSRSWCSRCYLKDYYERKGRKRSGNRRGNRNTNSKRVYGGRSTSSKNTFGTDSSDAEKSKRRPRKSAVVHRAIRLDEEDFMYYPGQYSFYE